MDAPEKKRFILAFDSLSGLVAGIITWIASPVLSSLHQMPLGFIRFIAMVNLGYGLYSGSLFLLIRWKPQVPVGCLAFLVMANSGWAVHCLVQAWIRREEASFFGLGHLVFEAAYVGVLAFIEARIFFPGRGVSKVGK